MAARTSLTALALLLLLTVPGAAQSWDEQIVAGPPDTDLASGVAASATVIAIGQPHRNPYANPLILDVVKVFERQGGSFVEVAELTSAEPVQTNASYGVDLALDGDLLAVGDPAAPGPGFTTGAVHLYRRGTGGWALEQVVRPTTIGLSALEFGATLDLEGGRLVVGAPTSTVASGTIEDGAVYVFEETPGGFVEVQRIDNPEPLIFGNFGRDLDLDGERLLVGSPGGAPDGVAHLFEHGGGGFTRLNDFQPAQPVSGGGFGYRVALDGPRVAVTTPGVSIVNVGDGRVTIFEDQGGWVETATLEYTTQRAYNRFGNDLSFEGGSLFVTSDGTCSARRYDPSPAGWVHAESYITSAGLVWSAQMPVRVRAVDGQVVLTEPQGATVFPREVGAELEIGCPGDPHPLSATGFPVLLDVRGQLALSEPTLPFLVVADAGMGPGLLFYGFGPASKPFGGSATLCVQGPVARAALGEPLASAFLTVELDLQGKPVVGSSKAIAPGVDVYFQYWFRVPSTSSTHLSSSLRAVFVP